MIPEWIFRNHRKTPLILFCTIKNAFFFNLRGNQIGECINLANPKAAANSILKCMSFYLTITLLIH